MSGHRSFTTALAVLLLAAPLAAQSGSQDSTAQNPAPVAATSPVTERAPSLVPTRANTSVGVRAVASTTLPATTPAPAEVSRSPAMMIVGGAALIVGSLLANPAGVIVMVVGGVILLIGLWNFLQ